MSKQHPHPDDTQYDRAPGWYRVKLGFNLANWAIGRYTGSGMWFVCGQTAVEDELTVAEMVMTLNGELCAGGAQHDPVFNTKQEG